MSRLIDAEELLMRRFLKRDRSDVITGSDIYMAGWNDAIDEIVDNAPTIDAVEVVRCKDCKWWERCNNVKDYVDGFCSDGERKEE